MNFLAISGSTQRNSTSTALLRALQAVAHPVHHLTIYDQIADLPIFSPDLAELETPELIADLAFAISQADGLIFASPEYVRSIPGGLKNAIDWLVPRNELIGKPIVLAHASIRGDDMLNHLRLVLSTVSERFNKDHFLRFNLTGLSPEAVSDMLLEQSNQTQLQSFLNEFGELCRSAMS